MQSRIYRIFVSSPSDVRQERAIAERVIAKLSREFTHHCELVAILWEHEPLLASRHFQDENNIPAASTADVCVVILWSRLGVPLPAPAFRGVLSGREVTGTEWEFEDALRSFRDRGLPELLVYRKTAEITVNLSDEPAFEESLRQKRLVQDFFERWFRPTNGPAVSAASHEFATTEEFEGRLETHLRALVMRRLKRDLGLAGEPGVMTWSGPPWRALAPFEVAQAPIFFGRAKARNELRDLLAAQIGAASAFVLVVGASGAGKSSLVRAGLLPDLLLPGMLGNVGLVRYGIMGPAEAGGDLLQGLADSLLAADALPELASLEYGRDTLADQIRQSPEQIVFAVRQGLRQASIGKLTEIGQARLVLVVDQLEELFTASSITPRDLAAFVAALAALATSGLVWVIATLRADFLGRLEQLPGLGELARRGTYLLLPPNLAELAEIVGKPAHAAGLCFEVNPTTGERLDNEIVAAAAADPGALPLLSFVLDALWRQPRAGTELNFAAYRALGGLEGAIANHAESAVSTLPEAALGVLPALLLGLVSIREGDEQATSRTGRWTELVREPVAELVLDRLVEARLLIVEKTGQGTTVRLAHEALLRNWPRLARLIGESRTQLATMTMLREDCSRWLQEVRSPDLLLPAGKRLAEGKDLLERHTNGLDDELRAFIRASMHAANAARRRLRRFVTLAFAVMGALTLAAGLGAWFGFAGQFAAEASRNNMQQQFELAESLRGRLVANALEPETDPAVTEAVTLSFMSGAAAPPGRFETHLLDRLVVAANAKSQRLVLSAGDAGTFDAAYSPDGSRIVTASQDGKARVWDAATGVLLLTIPGHTDMIEGVAYSHDGRRIVTASDDKTVRVWNALTGAAELTLRGHTDTVTSAVFSNDGSRIVSVSNDRSARIWDAGTGALLRSITGHSAGLSYASFSPNGKLIVTASLDHTAKVWDVQTGALMATLSGHDNFVLTAVFSPDGQRIVTASNDKTACVWDAATGVKLLTLRGHSNGLSFALFSPDGQRIATAGTDKTSRVWDAATGDLLQTLVGHQSVIASVDFSPDGRRIVTASLDKTARVWDVSLSAQARIFAGHTDYITKASFSPDGRRLVTASYDKTARIWDAATAAQVATLIGDDGALFDASFSPNSQRVVTGSLDSTVRLWNAATGVQMRILPGYQSIAQSASFGPDGLRVVAAGNDNMAAILDAESGSTRVRLSGHTNWIRSASFSPDGRRVATASLDQTARLWDASTGRTLLVLSGLATDLLRIRFSHNGQRVVIAAANGTASVWDAATGASELILTGHKASVRAASFSPDDKRIVTGSEDGTARVWDAVTGRPLAVLQQLGGIIRDAEFSPDGHRIVTAGDDKKARIWDAPDYLNADDFGFIRATSSRALDASLRAQYALPAAPVAHPITRRTACAPGAVVNLAAWANAADGTCHQRMAEHDESDAKPNLPQAFFQHALAARLLEAQGLDELAQAERYRREALAWQLPHQVAGRLMEAADDWRPSGQ